MPYITREDGERFVIPSYRDVLSAKKKNLLKREILLLSTSYGEYITLQRKNINQYEVAFSPDPGYLLGESIWHYFKRPQDMIYCEAIPNTTEAILVIVKSGSVYLDGRFPLDSIPEELVIFQTQQNNFEIYIYGDVPISETQEPNKFSFDRTSVKSFTVLDKPVFPTLPLVKTFQLQLVEPVLKAQGIGVFPTKQILAVVVVIGLFWMAWNYFTSQKQVIPQIIPTAANPYQGYYSTLAAPAPDQEITQLLLRMKLLLTLPGWVVDSIDYSNGTITASIKTYQKVLVDDLYNWANKNNATVQVQPTGMFIVLHFGLPKRPAPITINSLQEVLAQLTARLSNVLPANSMSFTAFVSHDVYSNTVVTITVDNISPAVLALVGQQLKDLPLVLNKVSLTITNGNLSGTIVLTALGS